MTSPVASNATSEVFARELGEVDFGAWRAMLEHSPQGSVYALPEYLDALCEATGATSRIVGVFLNGQLVGGVPLYERRERAGVVACNRSLLYYNGIVLDLPARKFHSDATSQLQSVLGVLEKHLSELQYAHILLHNDASLTDLRTFQARGWQASLSYTYVVPLDDLQQQWERVDQNLRRLVRRCEKDGVTYREDADFDALFRLHLQTHERKGAPLYLPQDSFRRYFERLHSRGLARLGHAVYEDKVIASQLMLTGPGAVSHTVCAGADEDYLRLGASAFLRWRSFESLAAAGYRLNDLTDAALNPVTRFKSQLGGALTATFSVSRTDSKLYQLQTLWREIGARIRNRRSRALARAR